ncbi:type II toxin-antitoxin system RelE family toxin [Tessaracoccus caeni]|uniref:type II toxin-antitoxin system RelE family toxin n=1 Tax=Tessaracoccus caeni TaxID=3031239 RepID=UPI0023DB1C86|nr:type II toxin-antitoxin system RelE/ParE family toxin [Tessaracoccus caeni]MDF1489423.1 type II toxin-antitoxin system RelE/ParE family toxin [Tessaracoccus caeni]
MSDTPHEIAWTPTAKRALRRLPERVAAAAIEFIYGPLASSQQRVGKPLRREFEGLHSARRGDYRILYQVGDDVTIVAIGSPGGRLALIVVMAAPSRRTGGYQFRVCHK